MSELPPPLPVSNEPLLAEPVTPQEAIPVAMPVEYQQALYAPRGPSMALFWLAISGWALVAISGLFLFLGFALTQGVLFAAFGILWIYLAGLITLVSLILGIVYGALALSANFTPPATKRRAVLSWLLPLTNVLLEVLFVIGGVRMGRSFNTFGSGTTTTPMAYPMPTPTTMPLANPNSGASTVRLVLTNGTGLPLESVAVTLPDNTRIEVGTIPAGGTVVRTITLSGTGPVMARCSQRSGPRWTQVVLPYVTNGQTNRASVGVTLRPPRTNVPPR